MLKIPGGQWISQKPWEKPFSNVIIFNCRWFLFAKNERNFSNLKERFITSFQISQCFEEDSFISTYFLKYSLVVLITQCMFSVYQSQINLSILFVTSWTNLFSSLKEWFDLKISWSDKKTTLISIFLSYMLKITKVITTFDHIYNGVIIFTISQIWGWFFNK